MAWIVEKLEEAMKLQVSSKVEGFIRVGTWGKQSGGPENSWSFELEQGHMLQMLTIDHDDDVIHSIMFTAESRGVSHMSKKVGASVGGQTVSKIKFPR
ncbi:hypothetical protein L1987_33211 [Smallanthus sonchifolius]|uniref:Uncharacterized protein n=1 Tax=Smallanthus sonchifolius TaxID=185202 RepID=A0ACB9HR33_9ASTR|nr:hypothetical protein L1987_33211 [Smallanthus sonchifolius]